MEENKCPYCGVAPSIDKDGEGYVCECKDEYFEEDVMERARWGSD